MKMNPRNAMLVAGFLVSGAATAATQTDTINVTANVPGSCTISATALSFGEVTAPSSGSATGDVTVNCSSGLAYKIGMNAGQNFNTSSGTRAMINSAGDRIHYTLTRPGGAAWGDQGMSSPVTFPAGNLAGSGTGSNEVIAFNGQTTNLGGTTLTAGTSYSDVVTVTVEF